ncbi:hypothetical protein [Paraburkholderia caballeronis]|uniref:hypothetical protein n=1 Tax=Paraburkholderia caballeronis TaxID=416943 RepID=UPI001065DFA9|nr:hypothetical protein [Paraburkholderia caballeronis]
MTELTKLTSTVNNRPSPDLRFLFPDPKGIKKSNSHVANIFRAMTAGYEKLPPSFYPGLTLRVRNYGIRTIPAEGHPTGPPTARYGINPRWRPNSQNRIVTVTPISEFIV